MLVLLEILYYKYLQRSFKSSGFQVRGDLYNNLVGFEINISSS